MTKHRRKIRLIEVNAKLPSSKKIDLSRYFAAGVYLSEAQSHDEGAYEIPDSNGLQLVR
jgi:hypothetical protein